MSVRIEQWVRPEHLDPAAMLAYRQAIHESRGRAALLDNFLLPDKLAALQQLFTSDGRFEPAYGLFGRHPHDVAADVFSAAPEQQRFYFYHNFRGPAPGRAMAAGMLHNAKFTMLSRSAAWCNWLAAILGAPLEKQTAMHARIMNRTMFMKQHDDGAHGALCAIFYLSPGWQPEFGSTFVQQRQGERMLDVAPLANRLLLFSPRNGLSHGVTPFTAAAGDWQRWSYSLWYGSEADSTYEQ